MKKIKYIEKIMSILMISISLITSFWGIGATNVKAASLPIQKVDLYSKGEVVLFRYDNVGIGVEVIVYKKDGVEYPAYCINKGRPGVTQEHGYTVDINEYITNNGIWKAIVNGYPFKTPEELGCANMEEAYAATKMAVYDALYHYDIEKFTLRYDNDSNRRTVAAIKKIITNARNSTDSKVNPEINIREVTEKWQIDDKDNDYVCKTYSVVSSAPCKNYSIRIEGQDVSQFKITDTNGNVRDNFKSSEQFKVMIPISELEETDVFNLFVESELATYPILYGKTPNPSWQNFAVVAGTYELSKGKLEQKYFKNKTEVEIIKKDGETQKPLSNSIFNLYNLDDKLVYQNIVTNEQGKANITNVKPGKYYLKEVKAPEGYYGYEKKINIDLKLNEKVMVEVDNYKEPKEEVVEKPQDESHLSVGEKKEIVKLPKTGI